MTKVDQLREDIGKAFQVLKEKYGEELTYEAVEWVSRGLPSSERIKKERAIQAFNKDVAEKGPQKLMTELPSVGHRKYTGDGYDKIREVLIENPNMWAEVERFTSNSPSSTGSLTNKIKHKWPVEQDGYFEAATRTIYTKPPAPGDYMGESYAAVFARFVPNQAD